ncbi:hypothetical protein ACL6C3_12780 [Capilliphycus salinus ALCB114379]|uniref:hypothetical protein n=1 Tax=Capilliphycus salinus TaxID=2768948 RepID=UPI0039A46109
MSEHRLNEIVIERSRSGTRISPKKMTGFKKELNKITQEASQDGLLSPYRIKSRNRYKTKFLSDHLGPLRRFLRSKVGQPWNQVYSELCQRLDSNSMTGQHVLHHVWDYVERHVELIDGVPCRTSGRRWGQPLDSRWRDDLYVHPETGILCLAEIKPWKRRQPKPETDVVILDDFRQYHNIKNIWYLITFKAFPCSSEASVRDVLRGVITDRYATTIKGQRVYAAEKKQCSKKEIKFIFSQLR